MATEGHPFLPPILSIFYAIFDDKLGPVIVHQVPEGLVGNSSLSTGGNSSEREGDAGSSKDADNSTTDNAPEDRHFIDFDDIRRFIIPNSLTLYGRLFTCTTRNHRIMGFPQALRKSKKYERHLFLFNFCFVFEKESDLSCFAPVVRKLGRVMKACEEESSLLSSPPKPTQLLRILEQLYEDLSAYAETSIRINPSTWLDLKIFPFYPNPPKVNLWDVPLALINLRNRIEENWDETMKSVVKYIDSVSHVAKIAKSADVDEELAVGCMEHLLYYQCIMTVDIFQWSNMYALTKSIKWLAEETNVQEECGPYITRPGFTVLQFPELLALYTDFTPGTTVFQWALDNKIHEKGIDARKFCSFGVIKGFLRRVHRYPYWQSSGSVSTQPIDEFAGEGETEAATTPPFQRSLAVGNTPSSSSLLPLPTGEMDMPSPVGQSSPQIPRPLVRRTTDISLTESLLYSSDQQHPPPGDGTRTPLPRRRSSAIPPPSSYSFSNSNLFSGSGSGDKLVSTITVPQQRYPDGLKEMLDGNHHTDELSVKFGCGWSGLEAWFEAMSSQGRGKVVIVCR